MKSYDYYCETCGTFIEHIAEHMGDNLPNKKKCPKCGTMTCIYNWMQTRQSITIFPEHMKATGKPSLNYTKMTREQKKYTKGGFEK